MSAYDCQPHRADLGHDFDAVSGWCVHGCGVRDDGRIVNVRSGSPVRTASHQPAAGPQTVEHAPPQPTEPPALFRTRTEPYVDVTEPRRGADR